MKKGKQEKERKKGENRRKRGGGNGEKWEKWGNEKKGKNARRIPQNWGEKRFLQIGGGEKMILM